LRLATWLRSAEHRLALTGVESPRLEAQLLAAHVLGVDRAWTFAHPEHDLNELAAEAILQRRERHEPLAYILGRREFYGREYRVTPAVLIPRQDTETLIDAALAIPNERRRVLDIGTGSGAIAITLNWERPAWDMVAIDVSTAALRVAMENAYHLGAEITFLESDRFSALAGERFDLIVTNPPYIGFGETLMPEVADYEPSLALFSGETGLEFYAALAAEAADHLNPGGLLMMEVGHTQAAPVAQLFEDAGWHHERTIADLTGIDRVVVVSTPALGLS